jgi:hypothetical protein
MSTNERKSLTALVWQRCPGKFNSTVILVLLKLAGLSEREGHAYMSVGTLAKMCGVTERYAHVVLKDLRKEGMLTVKHRKGHSSLITLNVEEIEKLAPVLPVREDNKTAEQAKPAAQPGKLAQTLAGLFRSGVLKLPGAQVAEDWQTTWPVQFQSLLDAGHSEEIIRQAARLGLQFPHFSEDFAKSGAQALVTHFSALLQRIAQKEQTAA